MGMALDGLHFVLAVVGVVIASRCHCFGLFFVFYIVEELGDGVVLHRHEAASLLLLPQVSMHRRTHRQPFQALIHIQKLILMLSKCNVWLCTVRHDSLRELRIDLVPDSSVCLANLRPCMR